MFHQLPTYTTSLPSAPGVPSVPLTSGIMAGANLSAPPAQPLSMPRVAAPSYAPLNPAQPPPIDLSRIPLDQHAAAFEYDEFLGRLTFNSKDLINTLSRVAQENLHNSDAIVSVLQQRIIQAPPTAKLPLLYLVDSIVKNVGAPFVQCFGPNLFHMFTTAYANTTPHVRMSMHRLLNTWPHIFGLDVVTAMRRRAADIDAAAPAMQPAPMQPAPSPYPPQGLRMPQGLHMPQGMQIQSHPQVPLPANSSQLPSYRPQLGKPQVMPAAAPLQPPRPSLSMPLPPSRTVPLANPAPRVGLRSAAVAAPAPPPVGQFAQVQTMMHDISRKASMGVAPSNHQLFTINRLITTLLSASSSSVERATLLRFQQQLRDLPARAAAPPVSSNAFPVPFADANSIPVPPSQALSSLLSNPPPGLLAPQKHLPNIRSAVRRGSNQMPLSAISVPRHGAPVNSLERPPSHRAPVSKMLTFSDLKSFSHAAAVRSLYADLPHLSKSDGMRFATKEQLRNHLDWLFKKNRSKRARERGLAVGGSSRCWFEGLDDILGQGKGPNHANDEDQASGTTTPTLNGMEGGAAGKGGHTGSAILAQGASERCQACHEELESFWSDDQQSWMLKDAIRTDDNEVYHKTCVETLSTPRQSTDQLGEHVADEATVKVEQVAPAAEKETGVGEDVKMKVEAEGAKGEQQLENVKPIAVKAEQIADVARAAALDSAAVAKQEASPISKKRPRETGGSEVQAQDGMGRQQAADEGSPSKRAKSESNVE